MNNRNVLHPALATLIVGLLAAAPAAAQEAKDEAAAKVHAQVKDASMRKAPLGPALMVSVEGLTKDNLEKVTSSLTSLTENVYMCSGCKHMSATEGKCTSCDLKLQAKKEPILFEAVPSFKMENIELTPFAARTLSYSDLEKALAKNSIKIDGAKFALAGESRLVLHGGTAANVKAIEKALEASGLFDRAKASYDAESTDIHVLVHAVAKPPMHDKVAAVIDDLDSKAKLVDVIWGPQPSPARI